MDEEMQSKFSEIKKWESAWAKYVKAEEEYHEARQHLSKRAYTAIAEVIMGRVSVEERPLKNFGSWTANFVIRWGSN